MNLLAHVLIAPFGNVADADRYVTGGLNQRGGTPFGAGSQRFITGPSSTMI